MTTRPIGEMKVSFGDTASPVPEPLPLRLLILGEFRARAHGQQSPSETVGRMVVDKDQFGSVMGHMLGSISLSVPNRLTKSPAEFSLTLPTDSLKSFHPDTLVGSLPGLQTLSRIRQLVVQLRDGRLTSQECRHQISQLPEGEEFLARLEPHSESAPSDKVPSQSQAGVPPPPSSPPSSQEDSALDSILGMVEIPSSQRDRETDSTSHVVGRLNEVIAELIPSHGSQARVDPKRVQVVLDELDGTISRQIKAILHHPEIARLEAVWSGLKFLVDRTNFRDPIQIEILNLSKSDLSSHFNSLVVEPELSGSTDNPLAAIIADYEFDHSLQDLELLRNLADQAESIQAPFVSSIGLTFLGFRAAKELEALSHLGPVFEQPDFVKWHALRQHSSSRWLALLFNRFLLRLPYGPGQNRTKTFEFREGPSTERESEYLWGTPVWALGSRLTESYSKTGWCSHLTGERGGGLIEDLPLRESFARDGSDRQYPLECFLSDPQHQDLAKQGILALTCRLNSDSAVMLSAPTVHLPEIYSDATSTDHSRAQASLPYQLIAGRVVHLINMARRHPGEGQSPASIQHTISQVLSSVVPVATGAEEVVEVRVGESQDRMDSYEVSISLMPDRCGLGHFPPISLQFLYRK